MTVDEARNSIEELKAQGLSDEGIAASLYSMFKDDKIDLDQFGALVKLVGYDLSDEFMAMSDEEKKNQEVGEFGISDDEENDESENENAQDDSNDAGDNQEDEQQDEQEKDENPFEKDYNKKSSDEEDEEMKKMFGF